MNISTSKTERQQFDHPGEGGILGMGRQAARRERQREHAIRERVAPVLQYYMQVA